jgi:hypothetical protein
MALLTALVLSGCMQATLNPVSDANFTARDKQQLSAALFAARTHGIDIWSLIAAGRACSSLLTRSTGSS